MKKKYLILVIVLVLVVLFLAVFRLGGEDSWIKDKRGVWIKHGVPSKTPNYVINQQEIINQALALYEEKKQEIEFSSECLGIVQDYAVDIVHVPRIEEDDLTENQCEDYREGNVNHFIELDKYGNIVRIV